MNFEKLIQDIYAWVPSLAIFIVGVGITFPLKKLLIKTDEIDIKGSRWARQLILFSISVFFITIFLISLPISESTKGQLFNLLGIAVTATIALSSTTFVGNAMAGFMIKAIDPFRPGDFLTIEEHVGRVTEKGLFHVEIQTELKGLITLPNMYLIKNPVTVVHPSGVVVSARVSLGYDNPRSTIKALLLKAGEKTGLKDPFVHIMELGDFSVTYRLSGVLTNVKYFFSYSSELRANMLDVLHENGVEIVSPNFTNQRRYTLDQPFIPKTVKTKTKEPAKSAEDIIFDKADEAQSLEKIKEKIGKNLKEIEALKEMGDESSKIRIEQLKSRVEKLKVLAEKRAKEIEEEKK